MSTPTDLAPKPVAQRSRRLPILLAIAVLVATVIAAALLLFGGQPTAEPEPAPAIELSLGESDSLSSCLQFDVAILADMPLALLGTAQSVDDTAATLSVDRWYTGGDADVVTLVAEHRSTALIAGFDLVPGEQYLISATNGTVNYCGYSGPATPELLAAYDEAFIR